LPVGFGASAGLRRGELAGLRWNRIDPEAGRVDIDLVVSDAGGHVSIDRASKGQTRSLRLDQQTARLLAELKRRAEDRARLCGVELVPDAFVFSHSPDGSTPVRPSYLTRCMRQLNRNRGLERAEFDAALQAASRSLRGSASPSGG
jgi:integrase